MTCLNISRSISLQQSLSPNHQRLSPHSSDKFQSQTNHLGHAELLNTNVRGLYYFQYSLTLLMMWPLAHSQQKKVQLYFFQLKNPIQSTNHVKKCLEEGKGKEEENVSVQRCMGWAGSCCLQEARSLWALAGKRADEQKSATCGKKFIGLIKL